MKLHSRGNYSGAYIGKDNCPFCDNLEKQKEYIIHETTHWFVMHNKFPYFGNNKHLMAIPKKHRKNTIELTKNELTDFKNIETFFYNYYKGNNYFSFLRHTEGGRSIEHLHYHYMNGIISPTTINNNKYLKIF